MNLDRLNSLSVLEATTELSRCCGATEWVKQMVAGRPYRDSATLFDKALDVWARLDEKSWLEAFMHHPKIGDVDSLRKKFASTASWAAHEQKGAAAAPESVLHQLKVDNDAYEKKFGFIFIVCATGKSAAEMLDLLQKRSGHDRPTELRLAAAEQAKITQLRLEKLP